MNWVSLLVVLMLNNLEWLMIDMDWIWFVIFSGGV